MNNIVNDTIINYYKLDEGVIDAVKNIWNWITGNNKNSKQTNNNILPAYQYPIFPSTNTLNITQITNNDICKLTADIMLKLDTSNLLNTKLITKIITNNYLGFLKNKDIISDNESNENSSNNSSNDIEITGLNLNDDKNEIDKINQDTETFLSDEKLKDDEQDAIKYAKTLNKDFLPLSEYIKKYNDILDKIYYIYSSDTKNTKDIHTAPDTYHDMLNAFNKRILEQNSKTKPKYEMYTSLAYIELFFQTIVSDKTIDHIKAMKKSKKYYLNALETLDTYALNTYKNIKQNLQKIYPNLLDDWKTFFEAMTRRKLNI